MGFKINIDRHGFSRKPKPERVSRDYAAEYARKLTEDEAAARESQDGKITDELETVKNDVETPNSFVEQNIIFKHLNIRIADLGFVVLIIHVFVQ